MPYANAITTYPADYLHYWWEHYEGGTSFLTGRYFQAKQQILSRQLRNAKQRRRRFIKRASADSGISIDKLDELYRQLDADPKALSGDLDEFSVLPNRGKEPISIEEALGIVEKSDFAWLNELNEGARILYQVAQKIVSPELIRNFGEAIIDEYILNSVAAGRMLPNTSKSQAAKEIIANFRNSQADGTMFDMPQTLENGNIRGYENLTRTEKEVLALLASISMMQGVKDVPTGWDNVTKSWKNQCRGLTITAGTSSHELASSMALLSATQKVLEKEEEISKMLMPKTIGTSQIRIRQNFTSNDTWVALKNRVNASLKRINRKVSKSDSEIVMMKDNLEVSLIRATDKRHLSFYPNNPLIKRSGAYLSLHHNANFLNFLNREMSMNSKEMHGLVQLLVARSSRENLDSYWEQFKDNVAYNGFLSALAGYARQEQAQYMIIGDRIVSVEQIIQSAMNQDVTPYATYSPDYSRSDFATKAPWIGKTGPNLVAAVERSEIAWNNTSRMLNAMILDIKMDISKNFITNILRV